ncbi:MAG: 5'/3'-nucleotidase SurE [Clostridiales bacterium]|nr:5'/3'-nucleotidase SurE [Clostridiales bacterium]
MNILITNDDGIEALGIRKLTAALSEYGDVYVAAPAEQQSAKSQSITTREQIHPVEVPMFGAVQAWAVDGTPTDCVMWAVKHFRDRGIEFDRLFSGINHGHNYGIAAYYSGTIGAAREGALNGIRSVAMSVRSHGASEFDYICSLIPRLMEMSSSLTPATILSVNAPNLPSWAVKGVKVVEVAPWGYREGFGFTETEPGMYKMGAHAIEPPVRELAGRTADFAYGYGRKYAGTSGEHRYDIDYVLDDYATISPLVSHTSDDTALRKLQGLFPDEETLAVFVDVQENAVSGVISRDRFEKNLFGFSRCINRLGLPSLITELYGMGNTIPAAVPEGGRTETVVRREFSAWGSADFSAKMQNVKTGRVMIAGAETHASVLRTALDFRDKGYEVTVIEDCCASRGGHDHKMAIEAMRSAGCTIMTYRMAVTQLLYTTNHPAAEAVMKIMNERD